MPHITTTINQDILPSTRNSRTTTAASIIKDTNHMLRTNSTMIGQIILISIDKLVTSTKGIMIKGLTQLLTHTIKASTEATVITSPIQLLTWWLSNRPVWTDRCSIIKDWSCNTSLLDLSTGVIRDPTSSKAIMLTILVIGSKKGTTTTGKMTYTFMSQLPRILTIDTDLLINFTFDKNNLL